MDKPPSSINKAAPKTTNNMRCSHHFARFGFANILNSGLSNHNPAATSVATETGGNGIFCHKGVAFATSAVSIGDKKVTNANKGTINKSSNNKIDTIRCPRGESNIAPFVKQLMHITIAVEVNTNPAAPTNAICQLNP